MSDRDEISVLVYRYAELLDQGDFDGIVTLFADAVCVRGEGSPVLRTSDEIMSMYTPVHIYDDGTPRTRHLMNNLVIDIDDGADEASSSCYFTVLQGVETGAPISAILCGHYHDKFRRGPTGWHFTERRFEPVLMGDMSHHYDTRRT